MSFEFTVLSDDRFIEILEAWVDSPWPKTAEDGYALRDRLDGRQILKIRRYFPRMLSQMSRRLTLQREMTRLNH